MGKPEKDEGTLNVIHEHRAVKGRELVPVFLRVRYEKGQVQSEIPARCVFIIRGTGARGTKIMHGLVGTIAQGFLEMPNVNVDEEMVSMIMAQRAYEINSKAIQTTDNMLQIANNIKKQQRTKLVLSSVYWHSLQSRNML